LVTVTTICPFSVWVNAPSGTSICCHEPSTGEQGGVAADAASLDEVVPDGGVAVSSPSLKSVAPATPAAIPTTTIAAPATASRERRGLTDRLILHAKTLDEVAVFDADGTELASRPLAPEAPGPGA
jgi:hypothetical protein